MASWQACQSEGVWRYAGVLSPVGGTMICAGLDYASAQALILEGADALDHSLVMACLRAIETGRLEGQGRLAEQESDG